MASTIGAVIFEAVSARGDLPRLPALALVAAVLGYFAGRIHPERTAGAVLALGCVAPALFMLTTGFRLSYLSLWVSAFAGVIAATSTLSWQYPARLRFPLIAWALGVAMTWPIVALRELDWMPWLLWARPSTPSSAVYAIPISLWIAQVAQVHLLGLLWVDWLFGRFAPDGVDRLERVVIRPLLASAMLAALLAVYQGFVDLSFLSLGGWAQMGRATGALVDANASGSLSALWVSIPLGIAVVARSRTVTIFLALASVLLLVAVWTTSSRTALLGATVALAASAHLLVIRVGSRRRVAIAVGLVVASVGAVLLGLRPSVVGPVQRAQSLLPDLSPAAIRTAAWELWARNGYGLTAVAMTKDVPLQGVGVGAFHVLGADYAASINLSRLPFDNAQNWFRHQLAEFGVLGSVGWGLWVVFFTAALLRGRVTGEHRTRAVSLRYAIGGFGMASLLGMPGQSLLVSLTFWTLAFWLLLMIAPADRGYRITDFSSRRWSVMLALALATAFAAITLHSSWRELRPPFRAKRFDFAYRYGLYRPFEAASGQTRTSENAVVVPQAPSKWLKLTVWVEHPDADERPVLVQMWLDHERIVRRRFPRNVSLTRYVVVPGENKRFVLETSVDRTFLRSDRQYGEVGLSMAWEFVDHEVAALPGDSFRAH